jgi:hypothetical protein
MLYETALLLRTPLVGEWDSSLLPWTISHAEVLLQLRDLDGARQALNGAKRIIVEHPELEYPETLKKVFHIPMMLLEAP